MTRTCALPFLLLVASTCCSWTRVVNSFSPSSAAFTTPSAGRTSSFSTRALRKSDISIHLAAKKKGFGSDEQDSKKPSRKTNKGQVSSYSVATTTATTTTLPSKPQPAQPQTPLQQQQSQPPQSLNDGQKALAEMRRQNAEKRDAELRKVREMQLADAQVQDAPAAIPEKVAQRMGARMLPFVGVPLFLGLASFVGFWYMATYKDLEFQPAMVATTTIVILATSLVGITYSVMSASWDEDREGDLLGVDEFQKNIGNIKEGLGRSRENAILRDRMTNIGNDEMKMALTDLERREKAAAAQKTKQTLESKLKDELE